MRFAGWASTEALSAPMRGVRMRAVRSRSSPEGGPLHRTASKSSAPKVTCDDCFFRCNLLCALELDEPCATFRPNEAQLRPPQQLRFVFRQERRASAAWAFPTAQEQAALHV